MAGRILGDLIWRITGDTSNFDKAAKDTSKSVNTLGEKSNKSFGLMKIASVAAGVAAVGALVKLVSFTKEAIGVSIDAQETFSKYKVVFSGMGDAAEVAADKFAKSFDLAGVSSRDMLANTGNLLEGFGATNEEALAMSVTVNTLASDLASFTNFSGGAKGASEALTKALLGERESAKSLGIAIREEDVKAALAAKGQDKLTGSALNLAKAQATIDIITKQAKNSIGDYARTSDGAANSIKAAGEATKELQIQLGTRFNPAAAIAAGLWKDIANGIAGVLEKSNKLRDASKAQKENNETTAERLVLLGEERKGIEGLINSYEVYDEEGKLIRTRAYEDALKQLEGIDAIIKGEELRAKYENQNAKQSTKAKQEIASWDSKKSETDKIAADKEIEQIKARKKANEEYKSSIFQLQQYAEAGLISFDDYRQGILDASKTQLQALLDAGYTIRDISSAGGIELQKMIDNVKGLEDTTVETTEKMKISWADLAKTGIGNVGESISAMTEALVLGEDGFKAFGIAGLNSIAALLEAIGAQLVAQAAFSLASAWNTAGVSLAGVGPALAGAAGAYASAGVVRGFAGSFEDGGIVPGNSYTGDKLTANVNSGERILTASENAQMYDMMKQFMGGNISATTAPIIIDGKALAQVVTKYQRNNKV